MKKYKLVKQDKLTTDQFLLGFFDSSDEAYDAIPKAMNQWSGSRREDFHVKRIDPRLIMNPVNTDYDHYIWSLIPINERKRVMGSDAAAEINSDFLTCNSKHYYMISQMIWEDWTVIDIGCSYNAQSYLFRRYKKYIGVDLPWRSNDFHFERFQAEGTDFYEMYGQEFINSMLPKLGLDLRKTFAICHYVPDDDCSRLVRNIFPNCLVLYP